MNLALKAPDPHGLLPDEFGRPSSPSAAILQGICACNMFGGGSSKSTETSSDQRVAASEGSLAVGAGGKFLEPGSLDLSGSSSPELGTKLNAGGDISISSSDPDVLVTALKVYNDQAKAAVESNRDLSLANVSAFSAFAKQEQESQANDLATALAAIGDLKQTSDEQAQNRKTFLYLVLGVLALLAVLFFPWKNLK